MFIYSTFINSITGKHKTISEVQLKCLFKKMKPKNRKPPKTCGESNFYSPVFEIEEFLGLPHGRG